MFDSSFRPLRHPFERVVSMPAAEFEKNEKQLDNARLRMNIIHEIVESVRQNFPQITSATGIRSEPQKERVIQHILEKVRQQSHLLHEDAHHPDPVTGRTLLDDFESKLREGAQKTLKERHLALAKLQLIGPFFGREVRRKLKEFTLTEEQARRKGLPAHTPDLAVELAGVLGSGFPQLAQQYLKDDEERGQQRELRPEDLDLIEFDLIRALAIREVAENNPNSLRHAQESLKRAQEKIIPQMEQLEDQVSEIPIGGDASGLIEDIQRRYHSEEVEQLGYLQSTAWGLQRQYSEFLLPTTRLFALASRPQHAEALVHFLLTRALARGVNTLGSLGTFATDLTKAAERHGRLPVQLAMKGVDRLWNTPSGKNNLQWILGTEPRDLLRAMKRLAELYASHPEHTAAAVKFLNRNATQVSNSGRRLGEDYMKHISGLVDLMHYYGTRNPQMKTYELQEKALETFKSDVITPKEKPKVDSPSGKKDEIVPKATQTGDRRQRDIQDAKITIKNAMERKQTAMRRLRTAGTGQEKAILKEISAQESTIARARLILAGETHEPPKPPVAPKRRRR